MWKILDTGKANAKKNMAIDADLLKNLSPKDDPILHFYDWDSDSATYGYFLNPASLLNLEEVKRRNLALARRPTGGGVIFHTCDLAFSALVPAHSSVFLTNTLDNYNTINLMVKKAVKNFLESSQNQNLSLLPEETIPSDGECRHFCMAKPTRYDVMLGRKKVAGAAQRKQKQGYLHQGSIAIALPKEEFLDSILISEGKVKEAMLKNTFTMLGQDWVPSDIEEARGALKLQLQKEFNENSCYTNT